MAGSILTPSAIWGSFKTGKLEIAEIIGEYRDGNVLFTRFYLKGKTVKDGFVKIYCSMARIIGKEKTPAVFIVQDFKDGADETFAAYLAKRGYAAFVFDIAGDTGVIGNRSIYPKSLGFANYVNAKNTMGEVKGKVIDTCWYEWGCVARYAYRFFKAQPFVDRIGAIGVGEASTVLWQLAATEKDLSCAVFANNAGWSAYRGKYKFAGKQEENFSDNTVKYLAGIEPQTYAVHIKCPTLVAVPTNSDKFDGDRAHDTATRLQGGIYTAVNYAVGSTRAVDNGVLKDVEIFLNEFLVNGKDGSSLPNPVEIKSEIDGGKILIEVMPCKENLKSVCVYAAEEVINPALRAWKKCTDYEMKDENTFVFEYAPYPESAIATFFAMATYKNGFTVCSTVIAKKFTPKEVNNAYKDTIIYSSRIPNSASVFSSAQEPVGRPTGVRLKSDNTVKVKNGPVDIEGINCYGGLLTFKIGAEKYRPKDDAILMLEVFAKTSGVLTVKLVADYFGNKTEYIAQANLAGGNIWHNVKFNKSNFKTAAGMGLKSYKKIQAIEIDVDCDYLVNNVLWV